MTVAIEAEDLAKVDRYLAARKAFLAGEMDSGEMLLAADPVASMLAVLVLTARVTEIAVYGDEGALAVATAENEAAAAAAGQVAS